MLANAAPRKAAKALSLMIGFVASNYFYRRLSIINLASKAIPKTPPPIAHSAI